MKQSINNQFCLVGPHSRMKTSFIFPSPICVGKPSKEKPIFTEKPVILYNITPDGNVNHAYHDDIFGFHFFLANCIYLLEEPFIGFPYLDDSIMKKELGSAQGSWQTWAITIPALYTVGKEHMVFSNSPLYCFPYALIINGGAWDTYWTAPFDVYPSITANASIQSNLLQAPDSMKNKSISFFQDAVFNLLKDKLKVTETKTLKVSVYGRLDTKRRIWRNINETLEQLEAIPCIDVQQIEKMPPSFYEQVSLFRQTDIFIAAHGAANVNAMFMKKGSFFIEIENRCKRTAGSFQWAFWHAPRVGVEMRLATCKPLSSKQLSPFYTELVDFDANTQQVIELVMEAVHQLRPHCK
eukprot:jgi/Galph1/125/GphlegSOOS_G4772.1